MKRSLCFLASYPKSGSTWVRALLLGLLRPQVEDVLDTLSRGFSLHAASREFLDAATGLESSNLTLAEARALRRRAFVFAATTRLPPPVLKIHEAFDGEAALGSPEITPRVIYVARNPLDVCCSLAAHRSMDIDRCVEFMGDPSAELRAPHGAPQLSQRLGAWSGHVAGWTRDHSLPLCVVRYEDLHARPAVELERLAGFLGLEVERPRIESAVRAASFDQLAAEERDAGFSERPPGMPVFFRKGRVDSWREELTPRQAARIERDHSPTLLQLGYSLDS